MNYRHAFHAGNFADLIKHGVLLHLLEAMTGKGPLTVIDTHAGAGLYDLDGPEATRTGEAQAGIVRLMAEAAAPAGFASLKAAVRRLNPAGPIRLYPGSPRLISDRLGPRDRFIAFETEPVVHAALRKTLDGVRGAEAVRGDGWKLARERAPRAPARLLALIDPPFETAGDGGRAADLTRGLLRVNPGATVAIWAPLKDLASLYALFAQLEEVARGRPQAIVEVRLRPPLDPLRLNGCAVFVIHPPAGLGEEVQAMADWLALAGGESGRGIVTRRGTEPP